MILHLGNGLVIKMSPEDTGYHVVTGKQEGGLFYSNLFNVYN